MFVFIVVLQSNVFWHTILYDVMLSCTDWWNLIKVCTKERGLRGQNPTRFSWDMKQELWSLNSKGQQLKQSSYGVYSLDTWRLHGPNPCYRIAKRKGTQWYSTFRLILLRVFKIREWSFEFHTFVKLCTDLHENFDQHRML